MPRCVEERLPALPLFLCEQTVAHVLERKSVFMEHLAKLYCSGMRYKLR
jgi:hypothetical protein